MVENLPSYAAPTVVNLIKITVSTTVVGYTVSWKCVTKGRALQNNFKGASSISHLLSTTCRILYVHGVIVK